MRFGFSFSCISAAVMNGMDFSFGILNIFSIYFTFLRKWASALQNIGCISEHITFRRCFIYRFWQSILFLLLNCVCFFCHLLDFTWLSSSHINAHIKTVPSDLQICCFVSSIDFNKLFPTNLISQQTTLNVCFLLFHSSKRKIISFSSILFCSALLLPRTEMMITVFFLLWILVASINHKSCHCFGTAIEILYRFDLIIGSFLIQAIGDLFPSFAMSFNQVFAAKMNIRSSIKIKYWPR